MRWGPSGERLFPAKEKTWAAVRQLLEQSATACGRRECLDELVDGLERSLVMRLTFQTAVKTGKKSVVRMIPERSYLRLDLPNDAVHHAVYAYMRGAMARIVRRRDFIDRDGNPQREIIVFWAKQKLPVSQQLKGLSAALAAQDPFQIEMAWFGLTERAHEYLSVGFRIAQRLRRFQDFSGELEASAQIIPVLMLSPDFLRVFMPLALRAASRRGRRPVHDRDEALGAVLKIFTEMAGTDDPAAYKARRDEPWDPALTSCAALRRSSRLS